MIHDAVQMRAGARDGIELAVDADQALRLVMPRHQPLDIVVNLVNNAVQARAKRVEIHAAREDGCARIDVVDDGVGIARDQLQDIFTCGLTTKKDGRGFGLHFSALVARELGGSLSAASDGLGAGARFTLRLPLPA